MRRFVALVAVGIFSCAGISTAVACECSDGVGTPGYWMNHPEAWPDEISVGGVVYSAEDAIALMKSPVKGDKSYTMFSAYVAALLNGLVGHCPPPPCYSLHEVNTWLTNFPIGSDVRGNSEAWQYSHGEALYFCLDAYNNGMFTGIPSRDSLE